VPGLHLLRLRQALLRFCALGLQQECGFKLVFRVFCILEAQVNLAE
jgi:hypothetical protein